MDNQEWFYRVTPFSSMVGFVLILWQLFNNSLALASVVLIIAIFNIVAYGLQVVHRRYGDTFVPEICVFCWLFIAAINVMRLVAVL